MKIASLPGVFQPRSDSWLLAHLLREQTLSPHASVLDLCTGSGLLAIAAALRGVRDVTAVDVSRRAIATVKVNARRNGVRVHAVRGDLFAAVGGRRFDAIVSNPPYVPAASDELPASGPRRAWDAGRDGRALLDRICDGAPEHLRPGGFLLLVHSSLCGIDQTLCRLAEGGLDADVVARQRGRFGPIVAQRAALLEARGILRPGQRDEEVAVIRACMRTGVHRQVVQTPYGDAVAAASQPKAAAADRAPCGGQPTAPTPPPGAPGSAAAARPSPPGRAGS
jgi:release factor glutamine methyltransferase